MDPRVVASSSADLGTALDAAVDGRFPPDDGTVEVIADAIGPASGVVAFSAHFYVCAPVTPGWVARHVDTADFTATHSPSFLLALADELDADIGALDVVLAGHADEEARAALAAVRDADLVVHAGSDHPRAARARRHREDVTVWQVGDGDGWIVVGRGVCGRWEASFEVAPAARGRGLGRQLAAAARALVPSGSATFTQVSPGNVASLRAVLAAGYRPVGSEVLLPPTGPGQPL